MTPIISVVGYSNSGKTTLLVKLIRALKQKGLKIATIKHHHRDFDIDVPGKDTWRHAEAGADTVILASPGKLAMIERTETELSLDQIADKITGVDLIITEGYKGECKPKIEVYRSSVHDKLITPREQLLAVASDIDFQGIPTFGLDDADGLAGFIIKQLSLTPYK